MLDMLLELDKYLPRGAFITILASEPLADRTRLLEKGKTAKLMMKNANIDHVQGSTISRRDLEGCLRKRSYGSVLVLSTEAEEGTASDSRSLTTLLLIREIRRVLLVEQSQQPVQMSKPLRRIRSVSKEYARLSVHHEAEPQDNDFTLLGEIHDQETRDLVSTSGVSDYIMSNKLLSNVIAMVAEQPSVSPLFEVLFSEEGDELCVRDSRHYAHVGEQLSFAEMSVRARMLGDTALGFKRGDDLIVLNPADKQETLDWRIGDFLIVLGDH